MKIVKYFIALVIILCLQSVCLTEEKSKPESCSILVMELFGWFGNVSNNEITEYEYFTNKPLKLYKKFDDVDEMAEYEYFTDKPLKWYSF